MRRVQYVVFALLVSLLASCGFSLRNESLDPELTLFVSPAVPSVAHISIERFAQARGMPMVEESENATLSISQLEETSLARATRVDSLGRASQYRVSLRWNVTYVTGGKSHSWVSSRAESAHIDEESMIGFQKERDRIVDSLRTELVAALLLSADLVATAEA